jgi:hypothetical protein
MPTRKYRARSKKLTPRKQTGPNQADKDTGNRMSYLDLPLGDQAPVIVNMIVEIPQGSSNKYEFDHEL